MRRILLVDDEPEIRKAVMRHLDGYLVFQARDGKEALEVVARLDPPPDLIITDYRMPEMNGLDLIRTLKADSKTRVIPVWMMSTDLDVPERAKEAGAEICLDKTTEIFRLPGRLKQRFGD